MATATRPSLDQLKRAITISEKIKALEDELSSILGGGDGVGMKAVAGKRRGRPPAIKLEESAEEESPKKKPRKKREMSEEGRKRIAEAQKKRWAAKNRG